MCIWLYFKIISAVQWSKSLVTPEFYEIQRVTPITTLQPLRLEAGLEAASGTADQVVVEVIIEHVKAFKVIG